MLAPSALAKVSVLSFLVGRGAGVDGGCGDGDGSNGSGGGGGGGMYCIGVGVVWEKLTALFCAGAFSSRQGLSAVVLGRQGCRR